MSALLRSSWISGLARGGMGLVCVLLLAVSLRGQIPTPSAPTAPAASNPTSSTPGSSSGGQAGRTLPGVVVPGQNPGQSTRANQGQDRDQNSVDATRRAAEEADRRSREEGQLSTYTAVQQTEFQRLVGESTGVSLPIFGASLFFGVPSTFAPVDNIPVAPDYVLGPGDEIRVELYGQVNEQGSFTVSRTGDIAFPGVGTLHVAGVRYQQLAPFLKAQLSRVYRNFELTVNLGQLRSIPIFVVGEARRPGAYTVSSLSTLLNALFTSGGPLPQGTLRDIQIQRGGQTVVHFDLYDLLLRGDKTKDVPLVAGDVIFIPTAGPQVALTGSVTNPAIYELREPGGAGFTVNDLIALAGGRTSVALQAQVRLERIFEHTMRSIVDVDTAKGQNPVLEAGDIVSVGAILNRYDNAVTLRGNVTSPGRYVWHAGMRLLDLVPTRNQLITRDYYRRLNGQGVTNYDYAGAEAALQLRGNNTSQATEAAVASGSSTSSSRGGNSLGEALTGSNSPFGPATDVLLTAPDVDWSYGVIERLNLQTLATGLIPFVPGDLYLKGDQRQNLELVSGDVVTFFSTADLKVPTSQQTRFVRLEGEFVASGVYSVLPGETLRQLLVRVGGITPEAYLYGSEFTRLSTRRVQQQRLNEYADNLEAQISVLSANGTATAITDRDAAVNIAAISEARQAIARLRGLTPLGRIVLELKPDSRTTESVPDLPLEDGDRFVVPRVPSTVSVEGQVYSANAFVWVRGRKERDYLRQAGGPDRESDGKRTFILRADGSVYSKQYGDVDKATIFPGDTVVVPPKLMRRAVLRDLLDISSIVGQFGLGAAAINVLK